MRRREFIKTASAVVMCGLPSHLSAKQKARLRETEIATCGPYCLVTIDRTKAENMSHHGFNVYLWNLLDRRLSGQWVALDLHDNLELDEFGNGEHRWVISILFEVGDKHLLRNVTYPALRWDYPPEEPMI